MKLYFARDPVGNFGDDLNPWLWSRLIPQLFDNNAAELFIGIGTILNTSIGEEIPREPLKVVFGAGAGYGLMPPIDHRWKFYCVRGPLTAKAAKLPLDCAITDPAILVKSLIESPESTTQGVAFMPHHATALRLAAEQIDLRAVCQTAGVRYIDPCGDVDISLLSIRRTSLLITEALHGAVVADALRIPWIPVRIYEHILAFKWRDWCASLGFQYRPHAASLLTSDDPGKHLVRFLRRLAKSDYGILSRDRIIAEAEARLKQRLEQLVVDFCGTTRGAHHECLGRATGPGDAASKGYDPNSHSVTFAQQQEYRHWWKQYQCAAKHLLALVPPGDRLILVDDGALGCEFSQSHRPLALIEKNGIAWGPPSDDEHAIRELERHRQLGANYMVFAWTCFWWLDHYVGLNKHLRANFACVEESDCLVVFDLQSLTNRALG